MNTLSFTRFAGICAILSGLSGLLYAVAFIVISRGTPHLGIMLGGLFLLLGGLFAMTVFVALYHRLMHIDSGFALWGMLLGVVSATGAAVHGGSDFANVIRSPEPGLTADILDLIGLSVYAVPGDRVTPDLSNDIDPLGLLTFGFASIAVFVISSLMLRSLYFPKGLAYLGYFLAILLAFLYLGRLIDVRNVLIPDIMVAAVVNGFFVQPAWYLWLGSTLWRNAAAPEPGAPSVDPRT